MEGVRQRLGISAVTSTDGSVYNWSQLDAASAQAKASGKAWSTGVQWGGPSVPGWVGAKTYALSQGASPMPWDPKLLAVHLAWVKLAGLKYDGDPNLAYIVIGGLGANDGFESYVAHDGASMKLLPTDASTQWLNSCRQIIAAYAEAFPHTAIVMAGGTPFPNDQASLRTIVDESMAKYPNFGLMCCALSSKSDTDYVVNDLVHNYALSHPCGFQFIASSKDARTGDFATACNVGIDLLQGHGFIEIYSADADNTANAKIFATVNTLK
jgi:hypothetical protein